MKVIITGIYEMSFSNGRHTYIGSAANSFEGRRNKHLHKMRNNSHTPFVQNCFNKYGDPVFKILENVKKIKCPIFKVNILAAEQYFMDTLNPDLNSSPTAGSNLGMVHSEYTKRKLSDYWKGRKRKPRKASHIENHAKTIRGKRNPNISAAKMGRKLTEEHKKNISKGGRGRKIGPMPDSRKHKISAALMGNTNKADSLKNINI